MPLYEYRCSRCGETFEVIQQFSDAPLEVCQKCGGAVDKLLSSSAIQFKGAGWYINDYSRKGGGEATDGSAKTTKDEKGGEAAPSSAAPGSPKEGDSKSKSADGSPGAAACSGEKTPPKAVNS